MFLNSNTTLVKVKLKLVQDTVQFQKHSNTTLVKVKYASTQARIGLITEFKYNTC